MKARGFTIVLMLCAVSFSTYCCSAVPANDITHPVDGGYVTNQTIKLTGSAPGTEVRWQQMHGSGFEEATLDNLLVDVEGNLTMQRTIWDDFDDGSLDTGIWTAKGTGGLEVIETAGALHMNGTQNTTSRWKGYASVTSANSLGREFAINLTSLSGTGTGFLAEVIIYKDSRNYVGLGLGYDATVHSTRGIYHYYIDSTFGNDWSGRDRETSHRFTIKHYGDDWDMLESDGYGLGLGNFKDWVNIKLILCVYTRANGDTVEAVWDDAFGSYFKTGTYISTIRDIRADGMPMRNASWDTNISGAGFVKVEVRSSSDANMSGATAWTTLSNNQTTGLPNLKRYVQSRITLQSDFYCRRAPSLRVLNLTYRIPVTRVDFSTDGKHSWQWANGTDPWYAVLTLAEGSHTIWARAIDILGAENHTTTTFVVDVTPPTGMIVLNEGAELTSDPLVNVSISAEDLYSVTDMMLSEYETFYGSSWQPYCKTATLRLGKVDGPRTVYARFMDAHGLMSDIVSDIIHLDTHPPEGGVSINGDALMTNSTNVVLDLWAEDLCGVADMGISEEEDLRDAVWMPFKASIDWTLSPGDGRKHVYVSFRDALGQTSDPVSDSVFLDTTPPAVNLTINDGAKYTAIMKVSVRLDVYDRSNLDGMQIGEETGLVDRPVEPFVRQMDWTFSPEEGSRTLFVRVWDAAGNVCPFVSASIILDLTGPLLDVTLDGGASATRDKTVAVGIDFTDILPLEGMQIGDMPDLTGADWTAFAVETTWTFDPSEGVKELYCRARDVAGNVGPAARATILLDMSPPLLNMNPEGDPDVTNLTTVTVWLKAQDTSGVSMIQIGPDPMLDGVEWTPFAPYHVWDLTGGDGTKTLYARVMDLAGNVGGVVSCSIMLDTTPPTARLSPLPSRARELGVAVSWSAEDAGSGVQWFNVQCAAGDGAWTDWLTNVTGTTAIFAGGDGASYRFRVRAVDRAGNVGKYDDGGGLAVTVLLPRPLVSVDLPEDGAQVSGSVLAKGRTSHEEPGRSVKLVEIRVDGGQWQAASGTDVWQLELDLAPYPEGPISVEVRASDGERTSDPISITLNVFHAKERSGDIGGSTLIVAAIVCAGAVTVAIVLVARRHGRGEGGIQ